MKDDRPHPKLRKLKRGDVREDGMVFWAYSPSCDNGEQWATKQDFHERKKAKLAYDRAHYQDNKESMLANHKKWIQKNREKVNSQQRRYCKERRRDDPSFRILGALRSRLQKALKSQSASKLDRSADLLGCSAIDLKLHIESQFTDGMTWENYGLHGWHVDHIKPCNKFNLTIDEEQKECFHYSNLQPLWAKDNLRKSDK